MSRGELTSEAARNLAAVYTDGKETSPPPLTVIAPLCSVFRRKLKSEGLKYTPERAQVLDTIVRHDGLFDVEVIIEKVKLTGIRVSKATVYRTVKLLQEAGVVQRVHFEGDNAYYQMVYGSAGPRAVILEVMPSPTPVQRPAHAITQDSQLSDIEVPGLEEVLRAALPPGLSLRGFRVHVYVEQS
jgi:Fe2+ or Zn2+ uptake regulation protein